MHVHALPQVCGGVRATLLILLTKMWGSSKLRLAHSVALDAMGHQHGVDPAVEPVESGLPGIGGCGFEGCLAQQHTDCFLEWCAVQAEPSLTHGMYLVASASLKEQGSSNVMLDIKLHHTVLCPM